jgi:hypothetical protein
MLKFLMPRQARLDILGALHHIMVRGINKSPIFADDQDRVKFVGKLNGYISANNCDVYAVTIDQIIDDECRKRQVNRIELENGGRRCKVSQTRSAIAYRAVTELGSSSAEIARHLGVSKYGISRSLERAEKEGVRECTLRNNVPRPVQARLNVNSNWKRECWNDYSPGWQKWCLITFPSTMKITSSQMFVERSAIRSRLREMVRRWMDRSMVSGSAVI